MPTIEIVQGDIFESGADSIVIPTNTRGVMGAGLAKEFARRFPIATRVYREFCRHGDVEPGRIFHAHATRDMTGHPLHWAFFFPTKDDWRNPSRIEWIRAGLDNLVDDLDPDGGALGPIQTLAIPALGSGLGGLPWSAVRPLITSAARRMFMAKRVLVFEPQETGR